MYSLLIVDDESSICTGLKLIIDWKKYNIGYIFTASNYTDAVEIGIEKKPDIVILDVCINEIKGYDIIEKFMQLGIRAKYIMISGHDDFQYARKALTLGAKDYLLKPIDKKELETTIQRILVEDFSEELSCDGTANINPVLNMEYSKFSNMINKVFSIVEEGYGKAVNLKTIADKFKINNVYLGQLFFKETGMKFAEYLKVYRLMKAKDLIENTTDKISYIAQKVGYSNLNYFYIHFKSYYNITPTDLRENKNKI